MTTPETNFPNGQPRCQAQLRSGAQCGNYTAEFTGKVSGKTDRCLRHLRAARQ